LLSIFIIFFIIAFVCLIISFMSQDILFLIIAILCVVAAILFKSHFSEYFPSLKIKK
jgi:1,4-dihydroxy-2-naphthoate octaprenyltransferase